MEEEGKGRRGVGKERRVKERSNVVIEGREGKKDQMKGKEEEERNKLGI